MSDERRGGGRGGFGGAFVLLIFVDAIVKFWVWIAVAFGAAVVFGLLLWAAFYAARRVDAREDARLEIVPGPTGSTRGCSPATTGACTATTSQRKSSATSLSLCAEQWKRRRNLNIKELLCLSLPP
jgi:hypothetical protein